MVRIINPTVSIIGVPSMNIEGMLSALGELGVPHWDTDAPTDAEHLAELYGRLCYQSFAPGLNPNVSKVREGNRIYLGNIIDSGHGSVLEHLTLSFLMTGVSRVLTHELVRHRVGTAISQESGRYVRTSEVAIYVPEVVARDPIALQIFMDAAAYSELAYSRLAEHFNLDDPAQTFRFKKLVTSAIRRILPEGRGTAIGWSANIRTIRHVLELRTAPGAEEEIRIAFAQVGKLVCEMFPNFFSDFEVEELDGIACYKPKHSKV